MRQSATNFINDWIATELLTEAPSGETAEQVYSRFRREAAAKGLSSEEISLTSRDPDMVRVIEKHGCDPNGS